MPDCRWGQRLNPVTGNRIPAVGQEKHMSFNDIWTTRDETAWNLLLRKYWCLVRVGNIQIEYQLNRLTPDRIARMDKHTWYDFLHDEYFVWKYTAKNRLATTRRQLTRYVEDDALDSLDRIRKSILELDRTDIAASLGIACEIRGLGVAGASGLLSLIYPAHFATVDQFVVKALREVSEHSAAAKNMNPEGLTVRNGTVLTKIMREKSRQNNASFGNSFWTPRTIEMALWAYRN
jgi:hypothetical protein